MAPSQRSGPSPRRSLNACGMALPQRRQHPRHDLIDAETTRVDGEVRLRVIRLAAAIERFDVGRRAVEHRASTDAPRALELYPEVTAQPDDDAERAQRFHPALATRQAPAGGDDVARLEPQRLQRLGLEAAKCLLARLAEDVGDEIGR